MEEVLSFWQQKNKSWKGFVFIEELKKDTVTELPSKGSYFWWNPFTWYHLEQES